MPNEENLVPNSERTPKELREISRKGGRASGAARKKKKSSKLFDRIKNFLNVLKAKTPEEKTIIKNLEKAQQLFEKALEKAGVKYAASQVDSEGEIQYNRKTFSFQHNNFPREKEIGSEAHRLAIWWARQPNVIAGDQTLISMNYRWYLVERFDDADNGYQVEDRLTQKQYNAYVKEWNNGKDRTKQSIQRSVSRLASLDKRRNTVRGEEHSADSLQTEHGRENNSIQRVGEEKPQSGQTSSNRGRDSKGGGSNKQKVKFSLKAPIEYTKDLIAVHNLSESKLLDSISLGGFAMPSIAKLNQ